jgi:hypothetical protein
VARRPGNPGIYAGEHVIARLAAGFNPLLRAGPGGLKPTARPDVTCSPRSGAGFPRPGPRLWTVLAWQRAPTCSQGKSLTGYQGSA